MSTKKIIEYPNNIMIEVSTYTLEFMSASLQSGYEATENAW